ncbi:MAG TPA: ParB/RepB/Spo0J family partition protein [Terriglobales bacterium]|jgi:ParB family chromosome partitioning protein|nr:ParB/RepB/Spo0J family partition protein [Terriglobales bacterium]
MNDKRKVLGRGLESLLPGARATATAPAPVAAAAESGGVREIPIEEIERNPYQTRTRLDEVALHELAASIRSNGVVQPVVVRRVEGRYQLIAGERRWRASKLAGKQTVPAIVKEASNEQAMEMTIIENLQREDLNPIEQARAYERLSREFNLTQEQMAQRTGKDRSSVANFLRLLKLPVEVQLDVESGGLSFGHAKVLMMLESGEAQLELAKRAVDDALSVRQLEQIVHDLMHPEPKATRAARQVDPNIREAERELERALGVRVEIRDSGGKGKIILRYGSLEDYDRVVEMLGRKP